jgi:hypothetical protein
VASGVVRGDDIGAGGHAGTADRPGATTFGRCDGFEGGDDAAESVLLLAAAGQPHVVLTELLARARRERLAALVDERLGAGLLGLQLR